MLTITQNEILFHNGRNDQIVDDLHLGLYLNEEIRLENVTFERFFSLLIKNHAVLDIVFHRALGGFSILDYQKDFEIASTENFDLQEIYGLYLQWCADYYDNDISFYVDFHGRSNDGMGNSMQFVPISAYKHIPLNIDTTFVIYATDGTANEILKAKKEMSLYDCISGLLNEISFYGTPEMRNDTNEELAASIKEVEEHPERLITINLDELIAGYRNLGAEEST